MEICSEETRAAFVIELAAKSMLKNDLYSAWTCQSYDHCASNLYCSGSYCTWLESATISGLMGDLVDIQCREKDGSCDVSAAVCGPA